MGYAGAIDYLYGLQKHGIKLGLDNTVKLLSLFNNPQEKFHSIHVAGTNGKGSTSAMIASILQAAEFRTGLFTSPHLVSFTERIRVNNGEIKAGRRIEVNGYKITAYRVNHSVPATGYIIEDRKGKRLLYTGDTGTTYAIWKEAGKARIHRAIIEVSFPNKMEALAVATGHLTPKLLKKELEKIKIPPDKILITHPKPQYLKTIMSEIKKLGIPNIRILKDSEFLGLLGPSGSGKSTILKCIYRTYIPTHGSIWYDSISYGKINLAFADEHTVLNVRHKEIGYVSQFLKVIPRISAIDIVAEPLLSKNGLSKQEGRKRACDILERLRIPSNLFDAYPCTFSGGEEKWINIARAIIWRPRFLLLDEPVASLDKKSMDTVILLFKELQSQGSSIVGIFHDVKLMERIADRIFEIDEGATPPISY